MAGTLNKVILIGRLGADPELKQTAQGTPVTSFNLATDESYKDKSGNKVDQTEWHRVVVWQRQAENVCKFLGKGPLVMIEYRLQTRKWQGQQGQDKYNTEIVAQQVTFLDSKKDAGFEDVKEWLGVMLSTWDEYFARGHRLAADFPEDIIDPPMDIREDF